MIAVAGKLALQLPHHVGFGGHQKIGRLGKRGDVADHGFGAAHEIAVLPDVGRAFRVSDGKSVREFSLEREQIADAENLVHDAGAVPQDHFPASDCFQVLDQVAVGHE